MKKIFIAFGHHNTKNSFNSKIRDTFIEEATLLGHKIDLVNLFDEKEKLPFYNQNINPPPKLVLDYRSRLEKCDVMFLIGACHNLRLNSILETGLIGCCIQNGFFLTDQCFLIVNFLKIMVILSLEL